MILTNHRYQYHPLYHLRRYHHHSGFSNLYNLHSCFFFFHQQRQKRIIALSSKSFSVTTSVGMADAATVLFKSYYRADRYYYTLSLANPAGGERAVPKRKKAAG